MKIIAPIAFMALAILALGCFNSGRQTTTISSSRFEVETGSVVLGAKQLLVDTSNGDVWILEGGGPPNAEWILLARGPEDVREPLVEVEEVDPTAPPESEPEE